MTGIDLGALRERAERELEGALRGASLCSVSRDPAAGASTAKYLEGRWYTLRDLEREVEAGLSRTEAVAAVRERVLQRTPDGPAWSDYRDGALSALSDAES